MYKSNYFKFWLVLCAATIVMHLGVFQPVKADVTNPPQTSVTFLNSGNFTVPSGVSFLSVVACSGGGGGGGGHQTGTGGTGGKSGLYTTFLMAVTGGEVINVNLNVGTGGLGSVNPTAGQVGGAVNINNGTFVLSGAGGGGAGVATLGNSSVLGNVDAAAGNLSLTGPVVYGVAGLQTNTATGGAGGVGIKSFCNNAGGAGGTGNTGAPLGISNGQNGGRARVTFSY